MRIKIPHYDAIKTVCPGALNVLKRYYSGDAGKMLIRAQEMDASDLMDSRKKLASLMEPIIDKAESEDRGFSEEERKAWDALSHWLERLEEAYNREKPSNPLPPMSRDYSGTRHSHQALTDLYDSELTGGGQRLDKDQPLRRDQKFSDWQRQHGHHDRDRMENDSRATLGEIAHHWLTGDGLPTAQRAMVSTGTGGVLIPSVLSGQIIDLARNQSRVMQAGAITYPMTSASLTLPRQVTDPEAKWRGEMKPIHRTETTFEPLTLRACSLGALIVCSTELVDDALALDAFLTRTLAEVMALGMDHAALTGAGSKEGDNRIEPVGVTHTTNIQTHTGTLASYQVFSEAFTRIEGVNGRPNALILSPVDYGRLDALTDANAQPLTPPPSWGQYQHLTTNQLDAGTAILADWSNLAVGLRQSVRLEMSRDATVPAEDPYEEVHAFSQNAFVLRVLWRGDIAVLRPNQFVKLTFTEPAGKKAA